MQNVKVTRDEKAWEIEVKAEIPAETIAKYRESELLELQKTAKLDGFRPGKAPIDRIVQLYGEPAILRLAAERAIQGELPELLAKENVLIVEAPRVQSDTPESGKPLGFTARAPMPPQITLPDWKAIAKKVEKKEETEVTDKEHEEAITHFKRERARIEKMQEGQEAQAAAEAARAIAENELPPLDDVFAASIGYETAEKFTDAIRTNMKAEKEARARETRRSTILDNIVKAATIRYPAMLREYEKDDMEARITEDLSRMGSNFDQYLKQIKKTREEIRKEWDEPADKRAKVRLILAEIARTENVTPDESKIEHELEHAKEMYPNAPLENLRAGIAHALRNEKVLEILEQQ